MSPEPANAHFEAGGHLPGLAKRCSAVSVKPIIAVLIRSVFP